MTFTNWALSPTGQKVITDFKKFGEQLYTGAPKKKTISVQGPNGDQVPSGEKVQIVIDYGKEQWTRVIRPGL